MHGRQEMAVEAKLPDTVAHWLTSLARRILRGMEVVIVLKASIGCLNVDIVWSEKS